MSGARLWPIAVAVVLALTVAANVALLVTAQGPDAAVPEPDYYRKAVAHDSTLAQLARDAELGWHADAQLVRERGGVRVEIALSTATGTPIDGAQVHVEGIHNLDPTHPLERTLSPAARGRYAALAPPLHAGLWELRVDVHRAADRFTASVRAECPRP